VDEDFWKRLTRNLAYARTRTKIFTWLGLILGFCGFLLLIIGTSVTSHTGQLAWPWYLSAAICVGLLISIRWLDEQS